MSHSLRDRAPGVGTVFLDISDVLFYLRHHDVVSGIQRVMVEVIPYLEDSVQCEFISFDSRRNSFALLHPDSVLELFRTMQNASESTQLTIQPQVNRIQESVSVRSLASAQEGDVLAILGAGWAHPDLFRAVARMKAEGAAVVVLMYDLIPVLFPELMVGGTVHQFRLYVARVVAYADRVPAISEATRADLTKYCRERGWQLPPGSATRLAANQWSGDRLRTLNVASTRAWERPFVLFVSTVEARKNHILALRGWRRLIETYGPEVVPDLVCVGRLGWKAFEFLEEFEITGGLGGKVHILSDSLSDARLAALYRDCLFTVYPSRYEGWGLPVAESLTAGKPVVAARNSSLEEVGLDFAVYFEDDNLDDFVEKVNRYVVDSDALASDVARIELEYHAPTWATIAGTLVGEFDSARRGRRNPNMELVVGAEYSAWSFLEYHGASDAMAFRKFLDEERRLPLTGQVADIGRTLEAEMALEMFRGHGGTPGARITLERTVDADLQLVLASVEGDGRGELSVRSSDGRRLVQQIARGEAIIVPLGSGAPGESLTVEVTAIGWKDGKFLRSFLLLDDLRTAEALVAHRRASRQKLRPKPTPPVAVSEGDVYAILDAMTSSMSWRVTKPLRDGKRFLKRASSRRERQRRR